MTTVLPHGESLRRAIAWISERRENRPAGQSVFSLVEEAALRFDLNPNEEEWLLHMLARKTPPQS